MSDPMLPIAKEDGWFLLNFVLNHVAEHFTQGLVKMDAGISLSEDPNIRFTYRPSGAASLRAEATDTDKNVFRGEWPVGLGE